MSDSTSRDSGGGGGGAGRIRINAGLASLQGTVSPDLSTGLTTQGPVLVSTTAVAIPPDAGVADGGVPLPPVDLVVGCNCQGGPGAVTVALLLLLATTALRAPYRR